mmetsp:Transcript_35138/g.43357  ORF Transcript_35138/g.43357 Transcript_35138/m.43357 type:complete len:265 (+) Transcript_35138:195-989(+)|eukprot:CAMPEP_0204834690 /NCGR_PEP_ID=MMETSP1346-20131115/20438_1 /ASSEMBLY_ACC=CAM_ASM_000771 /TAXON_ID=215587 /ORGANISM="Aplanochytrium stocchinoi, Strain GSBS06" /LENGTH=264 /DNA_ID=CAMNT_0051968145 /DNA_START=133 /DNA_END=927 /DNA_ORIENTATION=-
MENFVTETFDVRDKTVLITGASSGFGVHFARVLAKAGCRKLALLARRKDRLEALSLELTSAYPGIKVVPIACDVSKFESIQSAFDEGEKSMDAVFDVIVNNAGLAVTKGALRISPEEYDRVLNVNTRGCFFVAQEAAKRLIKAKKPGSIINIASIYGMRVGMGHSVYATSKAGLQQMTKAMAVELIRHKIRVNCINPGYFLTEINSDYYASEKGKQYIQTNMPMKRLGDMDELNGALLLLTSEASRFMTGSVIVVDGGHVISSL